MNIAIIAQDITILGGVEIVTIQLAEKLQNVEGNTVDIISCKNSNSFTFENSKNLNIIYLNVSKDQKYLNKGNFNLLRSILVDKKYDKVIIQLSTAFKNLCLVANLKLYRLVSRYAEIDLIIHGSPKYFITRYNVDYDNSFKYLLKELFTKMYYKPQIKHFFRISKKYVTRFVTLSKGCQSELKKYYGLNSYIQYNPYNFVEDSILIDSKENIVLWAGRLSKEKNLIFLLSAWKQVEKNNWKLQIIGSGQQKNKLYEYIKRNNITNVEFLGSLTHEKVIENMKKSKIYVLTSFFEGFPTVISESMNYANAIISTRYDGFSDELLDEKSALVIGFEESELVSSLNLLIRNKKLLNELQAKAYKRCKEFYKNVY